MARRTLYVARCPFSERMSVLTFDSSHPSQFSQNSCVLCCLDFANTQTTSVLYILDGVIHV